MTHKTMHTAEMERRAEPARRPRRAGLAFALAAAAFVLSVLAAAPASAQHAHWLRGGVTTVHSSNLNGLEVEIGMNGATFSSGFTGQRSINGQLQSSVLGVPAGMTARVCAGSHNVGLNTRGIYAPAERGWIRLCTTGDFFEDWEMRVRVRRTSSNSWFGGNSEYTFGPITVRAQNTQSTMALSDNSISENGGEATVTATLSQPQATPVTITVATTPFSDTGMSASDYTLSSPSTLTFAAGSTTSTGTVTITAVDNSATAAAKTMRISGTITGGDGVGVRPPASLFLRITDDETSASATPTLALSSSSIAEAGGVATVTATLDQTISDQVRVWVYTAPAAGAPPGGFNQSSAILLTIAAGATASTGTVTITAVDDDIWTAGRTVRVFGQARGGNTANPADVTLTITDNEVRPTATLELSSSSIAEAGGETTVTATLSAAVGEALALTVSAAPGSGTDFTVSSADTLTIAARATTSTGTVTITAAADTTDSPDKSVTVSATAAGGSGVAAPAGVTLTITDDDDPPDVTLALTDNSISENGGTSVVSATLSRASSAATTITVTAVSGAFTVPSGAAGRIVIPAGDTTAASSTVTITAADNDVHSGNRTATVTGTIANSQGTGSVTGGGVSLTLEEDDTLPTAALALSSSSISENGGVATVTATLSGESSAAVTITVGAAPGTGAAAADFTLSGATALTISAGATTSTGAVTVTANDNTAQTGAKQVTVSGTSAGGNNVADPANVTLTLTDDDTPTPTLALSASSIGENAGQATVTATLDLVPSVAVTITVGAAPGTNAVAGDFMLSSANTLTFASGDTTSTGTVTVTAVDNTTDAPDKTVTVSGTSSDSLNLANNPASVTLTITDDDDPPDVTLSLSAASIAENGGTSVVSAVLSRPSSAATTVTVTGVSGAFTVPSTPADRRIVFAAGDTTSTDTVTVTAVDDDVDSPNRTPTVMATMANSQGTGSVTGVTLTLTDDESTPTVELSASPASISENGGTSAISATLSGKSSEATTVTVTAAMGAAYTVASGAGATIEIAAGATTSTDTATVTAVNNDVDAADNAVTVTGTAANGHGVGAVTGASLTITDDDTAGLAVVPATSTSSRLRTTEAGGTATFTVALSSEPTGNVSVAVSSSDTAQGTVSAASLTFTASNWGTAQTVTLTGVDDNPGTTDGSQTYTVALTSSSTVDAAYNGIAQVTVYAINADDELGLDVGAVTGPATEAGGTATFTVALLTQPSESVTVAVSSRDASEGQVSPSSLTFSTSNWNVDQTVTVTGLNDDVDDGDVGWAVRLDPSSGDSDYNAAAVDVDVAVTTTDDDTAALTVSPTTSMTSRLRTTEAGGQATFTVRLATEPVGNVVLDVASARTTEGTVSPAMLTFTALNWDTAQTVTLTGANDDVDDGDQGYTATLTVNQTDTADTVYDALAAVTVYATNADDDTAGVTVSPETSTTSRLRTTEAGGTDTFTVVLATEPVGNVVLDVASSDLAQGTVDTDPVMNGLQSALTFTATNWNTAQTVTLTGVDDDPGLPDGSDDYTVTLTVNQTNTADPVYDAVSAVTVYARNLDDEAGVEVSPETSTTSRLRTKEDGRTATFTVVLLSKPEGADVTIPVASSDPSEGTVSPERLVFTPDNATTAQTVTVRGVDDDTDDGDRNYTIETGDPSSPDPTYDALGAGDVDDVFVVNEDDDGPPAVTLSVEPSSISEKGGETRVTATLSHPSSAATTVTVVSVSGAYTVGPDATVVIAAGETANPDDGVAVTATDDAVDNDPDRTAMVTGTAVNAMGVGEVAGASLVLVDDDVARFALSPSLVEVAACDDVGAADCRGEVYTAALLSEPTGEVTVTIESDNEDVLVSAASLTFTPSNWRAAQTVTVTAEADEDSEADAAVLSHAASGGGYAGVSGRVEVAVLDPEDTRIAAPGPGESATYRAGGHLVTITVGAGVPEEVASGFVLPAPGGDLTVMLTAVRAEDLPLERGAFGFGEAAARTLVDIELSPVPAGGEEVCLGVSEALRDWAGDDDLLVLLRYADGAWGVAGESDFDASAMQVCATGVRSFSPFAVGFRNESPRFEETGTFDAGSHVAGSTIEPLELPEARGGDGELTYTLVGPDGAALPEGHWLTFDADGKGEDGAGCPGDAARALCGMPPADMDDATLKFTLVVADRHGDEARLAVEIAIEENLAPTFGGATVAPQVYTLEEAIDPLLLPEATGGNPFVQGPRLRYALTPALPPGLDWDEDGTGACGAARTVCGTPEELAEEKLYTWTAEDRDGDTTMPPVRFTIEVEEGRAKGRARLKAINESILPELSRASWDSAMSAVSGRLETVGGGGGPGASGGGLATALAGFARANEQALEDDASWKEMLSGQSFAVALGGEGEGAAGTGLGRTVTVWGTGDRRRLSREVPSLEWSGDLSAFHLGADVGLDTGLTGGVGVSWYESRMDYVDRSEDEAIGGVHRSRMASVQPYMGWSWVDGSRLWASVGYGSGEVEIDDEDLVERFGRQKSDSELLAAAAGGAVRLVTAGAARVDLKGEGQVTRYEVDENGDLIAGLSVQTRRVRVSAEGSREYVLDGGGRLVPSAELGIRWDGGDGATGAGGEVGGGLSWSGPGRLEVEVAARWLVAHHSAVEEWGLSGGVRYEPRENGRGLSLRVAPVWGEAGSGVSRLWEDGVVVRGERVEERSGAGAALEAEVGYGVSAFEGFGVATPYTRFGLAQEERRYGLGWRLSRRSEEAFGLDLGVWRRERDTAPTDHGASLELRLNW